MPPKRRKPTIRALWLGQALREIRDQAGLTSKDLGGFLSRDASSIIRTEAGEMPLTPEMLNDWMELCGVTDPHKKADLTTIRKDAAQKGWWDGYRSDVASTLMDRAWMESKAIRMRSIELTCLPGLLQTPEYAGALMRARHPEVSEAELETWIGVRMNRQQVLSGHHPIQLMTIVEGHLLRARVGGTKVMRAQLDYLLEITQSSNVELRVLPDGTATGLGGSFEVIELADPYPEVAYAATPAGDICLEGDPVEELSRAYDRFSDESLDPGSSRELIIAERDKL